MAGIPLMAFRTYKLANFCPCFCDSGLKCLFNSCPGPDRHTEYGVLLSGVYTFPGSEIGMAVLPVTNFFTDPVQ